MSKTRQILCTQCDNVVAEVDGLIPLLKATDSVGKEHIAYRANTNELEKMLAEYGVAILVPWKKVPDDEVVRTGLCTNCHSAMAKAEAKVLAGGVFFECHECGKQGILEESKITHIIRTLATESGQGDFLSQDEKGNFKILVAMFEHCSDHQRQSNDAPAELDSKPSE